MIFMYGETARVSIQGNVEVSDHFISFQIIKLYNNLPIILLLAIRLLLAVRDDISGTLPYLSSEFYPQCGSFNS